MTVTGTKRRTDGVDRATADLWHALQAQRSRLTALAARWGMSAHDAEDAASEAVIRAASKAIMRPADHRDIDPAKLTPVLYTALRTCLMDGAERIRREAGPIHLLPPIMMADDGRVEGDVVGRHYVEALLGQARLSGQEQAVVRWVVAGHRHVDVAVRLGVTAKAAQRSLERARAKLRKAMARVEAVAR